MVAKNNAPRQSKKILPEGAISAADFRWFIAHTPNLELRAWKIQRPSYFAIGMALAQFGDYATGTRVNPSVNTLHQMTGAHEKTIAKVLAFLSHQKIGALKKVGNNQGPNGGKPYPVYELRREPGSYVDLVLNTVDHGSLRLGSFVTPTGTGEDSKHVAEGGATGTGEEATGTGEEATGTGEDNKNVLNVKNESVANAPDPSASIAAEPEARDDAESGQGEQNVFDEVIEKSWSTSELDALLADLP